MLLLKAAIVKNSYVLTAIYFVFLKEHPEPKLKVFQHRIWISMKSSEKKLSSQRKFSPFLQFSRSNFRLKLRHEI